MAKDNLLSLADTVDSSQTFVLEFLEAEYPVERIGELLKIALAHVGIDGRCVEVGMSPPDVQGFHFLGFQVGAKVLKSSDCPPFAVRPNPQSPNLKLRTRSGQKDQSETAPISIRHLKRTALHSMGTMQGGTGVGKGPCAVAVSGEAAPEALPLLFPNPTTGTVRLRDHGTLTTGTTATVTDAMGRLLGTYAIARNGTLTLDHLPNGLYQVRLATHGHYHTCERVAVMR